MDTKTFANSIREKYPDGVASDGSAYKDMPDQELTHRVITKYPVYKTQVTDYKAPDNSFVGTLTGRNLQTAKGNQMAKMQGSGVAGPLVTDPTEVVKGVIKGIPGTLTGRNLQTAKGNEMAKMQGSGVAGPLVTDPTEVVKGVIKGIPGQAAQVTKGIESFGKGAMEMVGLDTTGTGLDYEPVEELTAPSNEAQEVGYVGAGLLPVERGMTAAKPVVEATGKVIAPVVEASKVIAPVVEASLPIVKKGLETVGDVVGTVKNKIIPRNPIAIKSDAEILATPVEKLSKLTSTQRTRYFELQSEKIAEENKIAQENIKKQMSDTEARIATEHETKIKALKDEAKQLDYELGKKSVEEAQSLKPKVIESMRKNSDEYRRLVDAEIGDAADTMVTQKELQSYIRNRYTDNPQKAEELISVLSPTGSKATTVGEIYQNMKTLRQDIAKSATKGQRVFTADEMKTTNAIAELSGFLKDVKGIDLKLANDFWRNYAPMRDKLIKNVQPFTPAGAEGGSFNSFSNMIKTSLTKPDPKNANFIKATEEMLGVKIGNSETKAVFEKLSQNQKAQIAAAAEKEAKLLEQKTASETAKINADKKLDEAKKELKIQQFITQQKADSRNRIRATIGAIIGTSASLGAYNALFSN